jgi:hypothetical protein
MDGHVTLKTTIRCKCTIADQAFVGFYARVGADVSFKDTTGDELTQTLQTFIWLLS